MNLTGEQYWKWRFLISEMNKKKAEHETSQKEVKLCEARVQLMAVRSKDMYSTYLESKKDYDDFKKELEEELKISLSDTAIDPYTYEVRTLPKNEE